ncbi:WD40 repeat-like protein [Pleurotus eryngii]|uniref:Ribosome biogenesis protein NSA1 n=1 Tax=Pleurotus eryngii TaxID=5323 RepID=A0A9P6DBW0_PLEER|nr:WD40 repeat-like protein [Pleurotus eryngii]
MAQFLIGDELGNIKRLQYNPNPPNADDPKTTIKTVLNGSTSTASIQALSTSGDGDSRMVVAARTNKTVHVYKWNEDEALEARCSWSETRMKPETRFVGLAFSNDTVYSCTSNGALRRISLPEASSADPTPTHQLAALPSNLHAWRMSPDSETFAYGGDEVDLSIWNVEQAFAGRSNFKSDNATSKKRKRNAELLPGEIWRANNVPNDHLGLRQPIRMSSLTHLPNTSPHHLATGTQFGDVRLYDTRAARRPLSNWKIFKDGSGVKTIEAGPSNHQIFVSDSQSRLFAVDIRNGSVSYGYKGIAGAVSSVAPSQSLMASASLDRYVRIHSIFAPPLQAGKAQDEKGDVLEKLFVTSIPTAIVCDEEAMLPADAEHQDEDEDDDDIWQNMEGVDDGQDEPQSRKQRKK